MTDAPVDPGLAEIARRLRTARKAAGLTQVEVAKAVGTNRRAIYEWESGRWSPHRALPQLAQLYGVSAVFLAFGVEPAGEELARLREQLDEVKALLVQVAAEQERLAAAVHSYATARAGAQRRPRSPRGEPPSEQDEPPPVSASQA